MTWIERDGTELYYEVDGGTNEDDGVEEVVAFVGDVGYGAWQWGWQHRAVAGPFTALVTDLRGTGYSDPPEGPCTIPQLANDVRAVLQDCGASRVHLVGAGLGGMIALRLASTSNRPASLVLIGTAARGEGLDLEPLYGDPDDEQALRASTVSALSAAFVDRQPDVVDQIVAWRTNEDADRPSWEAHRAAVEAFDVSNHLYELTTPALVCHGTADSVWPVERGRHLAEGLPRGEFVPFDGADHLVGVERSRAVNDRLRGFLETHAKETPGE